MHARGRQPFQPMGFAIVEPERTLPSLDAIKRLPRDVGVILRGYDAPDRASLADQLARACRASARLFLVAGDVRLAGKVDADGVHLPQWQARRIGMRTRPQVRFLSCAAHDVSAVRRASQIGADAVLVSPVFATKSHPGNRPLGLHAATRLAVHATSSCYALGGMTLERMARLPDDCWQGMAAIGGYFGD